MFTTSLLKTLLAMGM